MGNVISASGLNSFLNAAQVDGVNPTGDATTYPTDLKQLFQEKTFTPEQLDQLKAMLPEGFQEAFESFLAGGNVLPVEAADIALSGADTALDSGESEAALSIFPGLFAMFALAQDSGAKSASTSMVDGNLPEAATPGQSSALANMRELMVKLKLVLQADTPISGKNHITADFPDDAGSMPGFMLQKAIIPSATETLQQQIISLAGKTAPITMEASLQANQSVTSSISSLTTNLSSAESSLGKTMAETTLPPLMSKTTDKGWDTLLGNRVMWMVGKQMQSASLKITPPNMGPIEIKVAVQNDQATVSFMAQHGAVRDALEMAVPRLREMFNESNLQLVNVDVNHKDSGDQQALHNFFKQAREDLFANGTDSSDYGVDIASELEEGPVVVTTHDGFLDDYA